MRIRPERIGDEAAIRTLTTDAFAGTAHSDETEADIIDRLRAAAALTVSLVAEDADAIVGHVAFSPVSISGADGWFGLGPVSVVPARQGQTIGAALIVEGLAQLRERGAKGCVLLGDPAYYARFGSRTTRRSSIPARRPNISRRSRSATSGRPASSPIILPSAEIRRPAGT